MRTWQSLLQPTDKVFEPDFGPNTTAAILAIHALQDANWYERVGQPTAVDEQLVRPASWNDALAPLGDESRYVVGGALIAPWDEMHRCDQRFPERHAWWIGARKLIERDDVQVPRVPNASADQNVLLADYVYDFLNLLMMEIVFSDVTKCTYFREQLQWFHAGHFPCGWEGQWPVGKLRVF